MKIIDIKNSISLIALLLLSSMVNAATLSLQSSSETLTPNQQFTVDIVLNAANNGNQDIVVADAVIEYETEMFELLSVDANDASDSDFYFNYSLPTQTFPIIESDDSNPLGSIQVVVGLPGTQAILSTVNNAIVAKLQFRAKQPPSERLDNNTTIGFSLDDQTSQILAKVIANDGSGTNVLTQVIDQLLSITASGPAPATVDVPFPPWTNIVLAIFLVLVVFSRRITAILVKREQY